MNTPRKQHYFFAFFTLPLLSLSNTNETYKKLDRYDRLAYLKSLWNGLGNKTNDHLSDMGLNCYKHRFGENQVLFLIRLPKPIVQPEAFYIGLIFWVKSSFLSTKATKAKCYTLELSKDIPTNQEVYVVGEILHGQALSKFDHMNYGSIINKVAESFTRALHEVFSGKNSSDLWLSASPKKNAKPSNTVIYKTSSSNEITEDDLEILWNKWTNYPVRDEIQEFCYEAVKPIEDLLQDLCQHCLNAGIYPRQKAAELGEWSGNALARLGRGSMIVGLEYPNFNPEGSDFQQKKPYRLLKVASQATEKVMTLFLSQLVERKEFSLSEAKKIGEEGSNLILNGMAACFSIGAQLSPQKKVGMVLENSIIQQENYIRRSQLKPTEDHSIDSEIAKLVDRLRKKETKDSTIHALIEVGHQVIPFIRPLLRDINPDVRLAALEILSEIEKSNL
jgi:hypothetical protein